jgi:hypothetical protein
MGLENQTLIEFVVLTLTGLAWSTFNVVLLTDYRGLLTSHVRRSLRYYRRRWVRRTFLWARADRARYTDEAWLRRHVRVGAWVGLVPGALVLLLELLALASGHVV